MFYTTEEILVIYQKNELHTAEFLNTYTYQSYIETAYHRSFAISMRYKQFADEDPFSSIWFSLGMLVSNKVGEAIRAIGAAQGFIHFMGIPQAQALHQGLAEAIQAVFKNMVTLEKTYRIVGAAGLELLHKKSNEIVSEEALSGFKARATLENSAKKIALAMQADHRMPAVIEELYSSQYNIKLFKQAAYALVENEQKNVLQKIYDTKFCGCTETIGEILSHKHHPCHIQLAETFGVSSIKVGDITIKLGAKDLSKLKDRMLFAADLIEVISKHQKSWIEYFKLIQQRDEIVKAWNSQRLLTMCYNGITKNIGFRFNVKPNTNSVVHTLDTLSEPLSENHTSCVNSGLRLLVKP